MTLKKYSLLAGAGLCLILGACTPTQAQRGNLLEDEQIKRIETGKHTKSDVLRLIGSPTTVAPFDDSIWYYIGQETEKRGILDPEIKKERIVAVKFAEDGMIESINDVNSGRINIPIERESTPTHGNQTTIMQEFLGNLGKFNPQDNQTLPGNQ